MCTSHAGACKGSRVHGDFAILQAGIALAVHGDAHASGPWGLKEAVGRQNAHASASRFKRVAR